MSSRAFSAALVFVLIGLGASITATWVHYQLASTPGYISFCDVNATFSCAQAYQSVYGRLFGVPVAVLGTVYFLAILLLMVLGRRLEALAGYLFVAATVGLGVALYLAWATVFVLGTLCLVCLTTYAAVIGLFFVAGAAMPFPLSGLPSRLSRDVGRLSSSPAAIAALLVVASTAVAGAVLFPDDPTASAMSTASPAARAAAAQRAQGPPLTEEQKAQVRSAFDGAPRSIVPADAAGASVVIVKFNDYQCPPCGQTYALYQPIKAKWDQAAPGRVRFITRDFPLEPECNPSAPGGSHTAACESAVAVRLAREKDKADEMEAWLFGRQASLTPDLVRQGVREVAGVTDFDERYASVLASVRNDTALGASLGVNSTPTFFVNGVKIGGVQPQIFDYLIEYELSKVDAAKQ
jgi:uncharacterized membrane protein